MQETVPRAELKVLDEERVVHEGERVEDVELGLIASKTQSASSQAHLFERAGVLTCCAMVKASVINMTRRFFRILRSSEVSSIHDFLVSCPVSACFTPSFVARSAVAGAQVVA